MIIIIILMMMIIVIMMMILLLLLRGAHIMFCKLDELMTSLLFFLQNIIDQFRNTCDKK